MPTGTGASICLDYETSEQERQARSILEEAVGKLRGMGVRVVGSVESEIMGTAAL